MAHHSRLNKITPAASLGSSALKSNRACWKIIQLYFDDFPRNIHLWRVPPDRHVRFPTVSRSRVTIQPLVHWPIGPLIPPAVEIISLSVRQKRGTWPRDHPTLVPGHKNRDPRFPKYVEYCWIVSGWWLQPLWKMLVSWYYYSQYMEKTNVPNHQPGIAWKHQPRVSLTCFEYCTGLNPRRTRTAFSKNRAFTLGLWLVEASTIPIGWS